MPFKPYTIDDSFVARERATRPYCDPGNYLLEIIGMSPSLETHDGEPYWRWNLRIVKGRSNVGRTYPQTGTLKAGAQFGTAQILAAVGIDPTRFQNVSIDSYAKHVALGQKLLGAIKGKKFGAYIADGKPYEGRAQSEIFETFPEAEYEERAKLEPTTAPAAPGQPPAAGGTDNNLTDELSKLLEGAAV